MNNEFNIGDLLRQLRDDTTTLVRDEVALAKTEIGEKLSRTGRNAAYLVVGGLVASSALLLMLMALGHLLGGIFLREGMDPGNAAFCGFLIIAVIAGVVAGLLISKALKTLANESVIPERTARSLHEDKQWAQNKMS